MINFFILYRNYKYGEAPEIFPGRTEGLRLVLDSHTDQVESGSIGDNFRGFHTVIDGRDKYPFTSKNGILIKSGQENEVAISATRFDADTKIRGVNSTKRNCYFSDEYSLKLHKKYTQANCLFQCKIRHVRDLMKQENTTLGSCAPWFYPVEDQYLHEICDPWRSERFQTLFKNVPGTACKHCLPDCSTTKYKSSISAAPFRSCDRTNLGVSPLCDLSTDSNMMMNPPLWKFTMEGEYEKFNGGGGLPEFVKKQNVSSNIRYYAPKEEVEQLIFRAQREKKLTYNAIEEDITIVNFYFDEAEVVQFTTFPRMTFMNFISSVRSDFKNIHSFACIVFYLYKINDMLIIQ